MRIAVDVRELCGRFPLTGSAALRRVPGRTGFALAVGGFHPRFPVPPGFPALQPVTVALTQTGVTSAVIA